VLINGYTDIDKIILAKKDSF